MVQHPITYLSLGTSFSLPPLPTYLHVLLPSTCSLWPLLSISSVTPYPGHPALLPAKLWQPLFFFHSCCLQSIFTSWPNWCFLKQSHIMSFLCLKHLSSLPLHVEQNPTSLPWSAVLCVYWLLSKLDSISSSLSTCSWHSVHPRGFDACRVF